MSINKLVILLSIILLGFLFSCVNELKKDSQNPFAGCKFGTPEAIFSPKLSQVKTHSFNIKGEAAIEKMDLNNGKQLEIIQTGCSSIHQEMLFRLPLSAEATPLVKLASEELAALAAFSDNYMIFNMWAEAIEQNASEFSPGKEVELEPGKFVNLDKIKSSDGVLLRIILSMR